MTPANPHLFTRRINNWIAPGFMLLTVAVILLSLAGYLGKFHYYLEQTASLKLQYLLVGLCPFIYFTLTRRQIWWIVSLFCVLINLAEILPWYIPQRGVTSASSGQPIRLFQLNVLDNNRQYDNVISLVRKEKPAIAVFQEANKPWREKLQVLKDILPYHVGSEKMEIEIYSSLPLTKPTIQKYGQLHRNGTMRGNVVTDVTIKGKVLTIIGSHTYPQQTFGIKGFESRNKHLEEGIGDYVGQLKKSVVVIGDLNVTMWSPYYRTMIQRSGLRNARAGFGILPSQSSLSLLTPGLATPIDHCLVSPDIQVVNMRKGPNVGSDHLPLITDIIIPLS